MSKRGVRLSAKKRKVTDVSPNKDGTVTVRCITNADVKKVIFEGLPAENKRTLVSKRKSKLIEENKDSDEENIRKNEKISERKKSGDSEKRSVNKKTTNSVRKRLKTAKEESDSDDDSIYSNDEDDEANEYCEKPSGICSDEDVAGDEICSFRTPKKRQAMYKKALESAGKMSNTGSPKSILKTPTSKLKTPLQAQRLSLTTPRKRASVVKLTASSTKVKDSPMGKSAAVNPNTPYNLRVRNKRAIQTHVRSLKALDNDEDSDYRGSDDNSSESESDESLSEKDEESSSDSGKGSEGPVCRRSLTFQNLSAKRKKTKDTNYVFTAEQYFESQSVKCTTSDRRLSRLQTPLLDRTTLQDLLSHCSLSHSQILAERLTDDAAMFQRWMFSLSQGFSILAYGLGSKYKILQRFHKMMLSNSHVMVVNGFFPSLTIKEVVETIACDLLGLKQLLPTAHSIIDWIESRRRMPRVFLIIHNLDAYALRCEKTQRILSRLASLPRIHLVASVDHINCPLLWDQAKLSGYNFMWEDTTSFLPYQEETSYETSLMVQNSGSLALSSLLNVYRSLPHNSRGVFRILLDKHLEESDQKYLGMAFSVLYKKCRDDMLVTSDLLLRTMLNEFLDHQMIKWRRDSEHLYIPVEIGVLRQFQKAVQT